MTLPFTLISRPPALIFIFLGFITKDLLKDNCSYTTQQSVHLLFREYVLQHQNLFPYSITSDRLELGAGGGIATLLKSAAGMIHGIQRDSVFRND